MDIWTRTANALTSLGLPMAANTYIVATGSDYPDVFLKYQEVIDNPASHADNQEMTTEHLMQVSVFSRSGLTGLPDVAGAMTAAGFTRGPSRELAYDEGTRHFGIAMDFYYLEDTYDT